MGLEGRHVLAGRLFAPETVFTFPAFYQDLPARDGRIFVDAAGRPLAADVFAADDWVRHGWSVFDPHLARRLDRERPRGLGDGAARLEFLRRQLAGARRFQALLARDAPVGATRYYLVQEAGRPTPRGGMIEPRGDGWRTSFPGDRRVDARPALRRRLTAPGDGHATLASQGSLAPAEAAALGAAPLRAAGGHFEMINSREALRWLVAVLAAPDAAAGPGR